MKRLLIACLLVLVAAAAAETAEFYDGSVLPMNVGLNSGRLDVAEIGKLIFSDGNNDVVIFSFNDGILNVEINSEYTMTEAAQIFIERVSDLLHKYKLVKESE